MQIWDTAGQESFRSIIKTFYRSSAAVFLVYNIAKYIWFNIKRSIFWVTGVLVCGSNWELSSERRFCTDRGSEGQRVGVIHWFMKTKSVNREGREVHERQGSGFFLLDFSQNKRKRRNCISISCQTNHFQKDQSAVAKQEA